MVLLAVVLAVIAAGCTGQSGGDADEATVGGNATILLIPAGGGLWGIQDDDGGKYYPLNLDTRFMVHGARVSYTGVLKPGTVTVQQWGMPMEVSRMTLIPEESGNGTVIEGTGIIVHVDGEENFFAIFADDGTLYRPPEIPGEYQEEGLGVNYTLRTDPDTLYGGPGLPVIVISLETAEDDEGKDSGTFAVRGTITHFPFEGGFYGIVADDGGEYLPLNLPPEFAKDGLFVVATIEPAEGMSTIQQWGMPVRIVEMVVS